MKELEAAGVMDNTLVCVSGIGLFMKERELQVSACIHEGVCASGVGLFMKERVLQVSACIHEGACASGIGLHS